MEKSKWIVLPKTIYVLRGTTDEPEQFNIYFKNIIKGQWENYLIEVKCPYGRQYKDFWRLESGNHQEKFNQVEADHFSITIQLRDWEFQLIAQATARIVMVDRRLEEIGRLLCIGDSITRGAGYIAHLQERFPSMQSVGIRTYDDGNICMEGRGGWAVKDYLAAGRADGCDSPFVFPKGISGKQYKGNTEFWRKVVGKEGEEYDYLGFQKAAKNWEHTAYVYDEQGYPLDMKEGDVVYDPRRQEDQRFLHWNGAVWVPMAMQPSWELDFSKYRERFAFAQEERRPDVVSILLGANDFQTTEGIQQGIQEYLEGIAQLIGSIHGYDQKIRIILNLPIPGTSQDAWGKNLGCGGTEERYRRNMQLVAESILERWEQQWAIERGIYIAPLLIGIDTEYGYDKQKEKANRYSEEEVERHINWVHPNLCGHKQMGDILAGTVMGQYRTGYDDDSR